MVDSALFPAIREAIQQNELGNASAYQLSFARLGDSGASFGIFQGDTNVNSTARQTPLSILRQAGTDQDGINRIMAAVSQPCPEGNPLSDADTALTNAALSSPGGRALMEQMDSTLMNVGIMVPAYYIVHHPRRMPSHVPFAHV